MYQEQEYKLGNAKSFSISLLRIVATVTVVFSHACSTLAENDMFVLTNEQRIFYEF